jgi:hypothetical protein
MQGILGKFKTPSWYLKFCRVMVLLGWLPFFLGQPMIHGGTLTSVTFGWAGLVLGGYCSLEMVRSFPGPWRSAPAMVGCVLYGIAVGFGLYFALPYIPRLFDCAIQKGFCA